MAKKVAVKAGRKAAKQSVAERRPTKAAAPATFQNGARRLKKADFRAIRFRRRTKRQVSLPGAFKLTKRSFGLLWKYRILFLGIVLIFAFLNLLLVRGFSGTTDVGSLRDALNQAFTGHLAKLTSGLTVFTVLLSANGSAAGTGGVYQFMLTLLISLAIIWALRHVASKERIRIRDTFYRGMSPLIPFLLVLIVICLQLIPLVIGSALYGLVASNSIAASGFETILWILLLILLACLSFYWICSSIFALIIVTLPDMTPIKALKSARELVRYRRLSILRKLLFLPIMLLIIGLALVLPAILLFAPVAQWLFFALSMMSLPVIITYLYSLYRELLA